MPPPMLRRRRPQNRLFEAVVAAGIPKMSVASLFLDDKGNNCDLEPQSRTAVARRLEPQNFSGSEEPYLLDRQHFGSSM